MPAIQDIIWTSLPQNFSENGNLRLSVFVSPRLALDQSEQAPNDRVKLERFPDFEDWVTTLAAIRFTVSFKGGADFTESAPDPQQLLVRKKITGLPGIPNLWSALFDKDTLVDVYRFLDQSKRDPISYPVAPVSEFVKKQHQNLSIEATPGPGHPPVPVVPQGNALLSMAENVDRSSELVPALDYQKALVDAPERKPTAISELVFHQLIGALGEYPELLKRLGFIVELELPVIDQIQEAGEVAVTTEWKPKLANFDIGGVTQKSTRNRSPFTRYHLDRVHKRFAAATGDDDDELLHWMLKLTKVENDRLIYHVDKFDTHAEALKLDSFAKSTLNRNSTISNDLDENGDQEEKEAFPYLRSAGISLSREGLGAKVKKNLERSAGNNSDLGKDISLSAEDLVRGYRIDVSYLPGTGPQQWSDWFSLCRRAGKYEFLKISKTAELVDEGWISLSAVEAAGKQPGDATRLAIHEMMCRWEGWSLCVPRPGKALLDDLSIGAGDSAANSRIRSSFKVPAKTLPRLRFGHTYRLRARVVDLAGSSHALENSREAIDPDVMTFPTKYGRYDPVGAPLLVLHDALTDTDKITKKGKEGESHERLVIRSNFDTPIKEPAQRHLVPPKTTQHMAELHGNEFFETSAGLKPGVYEEMVRLSDGVLDEVHTTEKLKLPYLPDPLSHTAVIYDLPCSADQGPCSLEFLTSGSRWPYVTPWIIKLVEGNVAPAKTMPVPATGAEGVLTISLPKGEIQTVIISSRLAEDDLKLMGIWHWIEETFVSDPGMAQHYQELILNGCNPTFTPCRKIQLVHAQQQPDKPEYQVVPGALQPLRYERAKGQTSAKIIYDLKIPAKTANKLELIAEWNEWVDVPSSTSPPRLINGAAQAFEHPLPATKDQTVPDETNTYSNLHEFNDTKHREVTYTFLATSRFKEYFPEGTDVTRKSEQRVLDIPSTVKPQTPQLVKILPTFGWKREAQTVGQVRTITSKRVGNGVRIYLKRPWYETGTDQLLGVLLSPEDRSLFESEKPFVTRLGMDPIWPTVFPVGFPQYNHFSNAVLEGKGLHLDELGGKTVDVAGHLVSYDADQDLYYCDVLVNQKSALEESPSYYPFMRLALASYQPHSLADLYLSPVVVPDFVQLAPDRILSLSFNFPNIQTVDVKLTGDFHVPTRATVILERLKPFVDTDLKWVAAGPETDLDAEGTGPDRVFQKSVTIGPGQFRLSIKEYETIESDAGNVDRLVYMDSIES